MQARTSGAPGIQLVRVSCYTVPTETPECDGTLGWTETTLVLAEVTGADVTGLGYTYADRATAAFITEHLAKLIEGASALDIPAAHCAMQVAVRNVGRTGVAAMAISAVDAALWDLKARLLGISLLDLLGAARDDALLYGSGGFTNYTDTQLAAQFAGWKEEGFTAVKMKVGREPEQDLRRVTAARRAIGPDVKLFVDANGGYSRKQALQLAEAFADQEVCWFEEPVSSDDVDGLRLLRDRAPAGLQIAAGEYGYEPAYFLRLLTAGAVDVLQADATRCAGLSGFLSASILCDSFGLPFSFHCAPALHAAPACAARTFLIGEYFHDHARLERMFFDGVPTVRRGAIAPDRFRPGAGLELKRADVARYAV